MIAHECTYPFQENRSLARLPKVYIIHIRPAGKCTILERSVQSPGGYDHSERFITFRIVAILRPLLNRGRLGPNNF